MNGVFPELVFLLILKGESDGGLQAGDRNMADGTVGRHLSATFRSRLT